MNVHQLFVDFVTFYSDRLFPWFWSLGTCWCQSANKVTYRFLHWWFRKLELFVAIACTLTDGCFRRCRLGFTDRLTLVDLFLSPMSYFLVVIGMLYMNMKNNNIIKEKINSYVWMNNLNIFNYLHFTCMT